RAEPIRAPASPRRTLTLYDTESEVDHGVDRAISLKSFDHHRGGILAHLVAIGPHAGERWNARRHELEIVEADDRHLLRNRHVPPLAFEQRSQREVVVQAEY